MERVNVRSMMGNLKRRLRAAAGLAAIAVPCAIVVHVAAEALALGPSALGPGFVVRHLYLAAVLAWCVSCFAASAGTGRPVAERRRRRALVRAGLRGLAGGTILGPLVAANLAAVALTQAVEGAPIAGGDLLLGLVAVVAGAALSAWAAAGCGRALVAALAPAGHLRPAAPAVLVARPPAAPRARAPRYALFVPNRPPPAVLPA